MVNRCLLILDLNPGQSKAFYKQRIPAVRGKKLLTCRKDLSQPDFDNEPRVQERQQVKDRQSCMSVLVAYLTITSTKQEHSPDLTIIFHAWTYGGFIEIQNNFRRKKLYKTNQSFNILGGSFSNRDVRAPVQFRRESQPQHLKKRIFSFH